MIRKLLAKDWKVMGTEIKFSIDFQFKHVYTILRISNTLCKMIQTLCFFFPNICCLNLLRKYIISICTHKYCNVILELCFSSPCFIF